MRDNPRTSVQQAADWIEYVHRHKGAKHLRPEVYNLYWYQYYLLDVLAFLLTAIFAVCFAIRMLFRLLWKIVTRLTKGNKTSKQEWSITLLVTARYYIHTCQLYDSLRLKFFNDITDKYSIFKELDINAKVLLLFNSIDPFVCRSTAAFVVQAMLLRQEISSTK